MVTMTRPADEGARHLSVLVASPESRYRSRRGRACEVQPTDEGARVLGRGGSDALRVDRRLAEAQAPRARVPDPRALT